MSTILFLSDNSWVVKRGSDREPIRDDEETTVTGLTARCYLSASKAHDAAAIHATLDVAAVPITAGKLRTVLSGTNVRTHITPLLDTAEAASQQLRIYEHVVVAGSHHDVQDLSVQRERPAE